MEIFHEVISYFLILKFVRQSNNIDGIIIINIIIAVEI